MIKKLRFRILLIAIIAFIWWFLNKPQPEPLETKNELEIELSPPQKGRLQKVLTEAKKNQASPVKIKTKDDLTKLKGIGPKVASLLNENGILTFLHLAKTNNQTLKQILENANLPFIDPTSWPEQAQTFLNKVK